MEIPEDLRGVEGVGVTCDRCGTYQTGIVFEKLVDPNSVGQAGPERIYCETCRRKLECPNCGKLALMPGMSGLDADERIAYDVFGICTDCWSDVKDFLAKGDDIEVFHLVEALRKAGSKCDEETWKVSDDVVRYARWKEDEGWSVSDVARSVLLQYASDSGNVFGRVPRRIAEAAFVAWLDRNLSTAAASANRYLTSECATRLRPHANELTAIFADMIRKEMT